MSPSPLDYSDRLSDATGANVYLKREDLLSVRSYKVRGAYNLLMQLSDAELAAGVVCSSAGNHAQGFALACRSMACTAGFTCRQDSQAEARPNPLPRWRIHRTDRRWGNLRPGRRGRPRGRREHRRDAGPAL